MCKVMHSPLHPWADVSTQADSGKQQIEWQEVTHIHEQENQAAANYNPCKEG